MPVVELVSNRDVPDIPPFPVVGLIAAQEEHTTPARVECEQHAQVTPERPQLLHVVVARAADPTRPRPPQMRPVLPELLDGCSDPVCILGPQAFEPPLCLRRELDLPRASARHTDTVASAPVTEQDAFVPPLSIHATRCPRLAPPPARRLGSARATASSAPPECTRHRQPGASGVLAPPPARRLRSARATASSAPPECTRNRQLGASGVHKSPNSPGGTNVGEISVSEALMRPGSGRSRRFGEICSVVGGVRGAGPPGVRGAGPPGVRGAGPRRRTPTVVGR